MESHHVVNHQSETVKNFKLRFEKRMSQFKADAESRASSPGYGSWRDVLAGAAMSATTLGGGTAVAILGVTGALTATVTAGASLAVAVAGIAAAEGYNIYRTKQEKREFKRAMNLLQQEDFDKQLTVISEKLLSIYQYQLENCSPKGAERLADACFKALSHEILTNKYLRFRDLLSASHLQALIVKSSSQIKKKSISINGEEDEKANTRGAVTHAGYYCEETQQLYRCKASKPTKYGVLHFETRRELDDYKLQIEKIKQDEAKWHCEKMPASLVRRLTQQGLFRLNQHENDDAYQSVDDSEFDATKEDAASSESSSRLSM